MSPISLSLFFLIHPGDIRNRRESRSEHMTKIWMMWKDDWDREESGKDTPAK